MKTKSKVLLGLLALGFLFSCLRAPKHGNAEKLIAPTMDVISEKIRDAVV